MSRGFHTSIRPITNRNITSSLFLNLVSSYFGCIDTLAIPTTISRGLPLRLSKLITGNGITIINDMPTAFMNIIDTAMITKTLPRINEPKNLYAF